MLNIDGMNISLIVASNYFFKEIRGTTGGIRKLTGGGVNVNNVLMSSQRY